jgi:hypothetical protein
MRYRIGDIIKGSSRDVPSYILVVTGVSPCGYTTYYLLSAETDDERVESLCGWHGESTIDVEYEKIEI